MYPTVALILDHDTKERVVLSELLYQWTWPLLATDSLTSLIYYLHDPRVHLCIVNTELLSDLWQDLPTLLTTLSPHQRLVLSGNTPLPLPDLPDTVASRMICLPYLPPQDALQSFLATHHLPHKVLSPSEQSRRLRERPCSMFEIDSTRQIARFCDRDVFLNQEELNVLQYLTLTKGHIYTYRDLIDLFYLNHLPEDHARKLVRGRMYYLQTKLNRDSKHTEIITCVRGVGYRLSIPMCKAGCPASEHSDGHTDDEEYTDEYGLDG